MTLWKRLLIAYTITAVVSLLFATVIVATGWFGGDEIPAEHLVIILGSSWVISSIMVSISIMVKK